MLADKIRASNKPILSSDVAAIQGMQRMSSDYEEVSSKNSFNASYSLTHLGPHTTQSTYE